MQSKDNLAVSCSNPHCDVADLKQASFAFIVHIIKPDENKLILLLKS